MLVAANNNPGEDLIVFDLPGDGPHVIPATIGLPSITDDVLIINDRPGDERITVERTGSNAVRILTNSSAVVTIAGLTLANGNVAAQTGTTTNHGGAIRCVCCRSS